MSKSLCIMQRTGTNVEPIGARSGSNERILQGNLMHCTAKGNIAHNFQLLKEGAIYSFVEIDDLELRVETSRAAREKLGIGSAWGMGQLWMVKKRLRNGQRYGFLRIKNIGQRGEKTEDAKNKGMNGWEAGYCSRRDDRKYSQEVQGMKQGAHDGNDNGNQSVTVSKVMIHTISPDLIREVVHIKVKKRTYKVVVVEEINDVIEIDVDQKTSKEEEGGGENSSVAMEHGTFQDDNNENEDGSDDGRRHTDNGNEDVGDNEVLNMEDGGANERSTESKFTFKVNEVSSSNEKKKSASKGFEDSKSQKKDIAADELSNIQMKDTATDELSGKCKGSTLDYLSGIELMDFDFFQAIELFVSRGLDYLHNDNHRFCSLLPPGAKSIGVPQDVIELCVKDYFNNEHKKRSTEVREIFEQYTAKKVETFTDEEERKKYSNEIQAIQARAFKAMQVMNLTKKGKTLENIASALNIDVKSVKQFVTFFYAFREIVVERDYQVDSEHRESIGTQGTHAITNKRRNRGAKLLMSFPRWQHAIHRPLWICASLVMQCSAQFALLEMHLVSPAPDPGTLIPALGLDMIPLFFFALAASLDKHSLLKEFFVWPKVLLWRSLAVSVMNFHS
ncbi:hypothetical protein Tco_1215599 [Tanacetum coccineum]